MEELEKHGTPCTDDGVSYAHRCLCRRTRYKWNDDAHAHKFLCRHTACRSAFAARARRLACHHNPCTNGDYARARKCPCRHNPCIASAGARARRCQSHNSPCIGSAGARARTSFLFWSCLTASRRKARGRESPLLRRRWRYFGAVNCQRSGWCGCDTRARSTRSGLHAFARRERYSRSCFWNRFFASPPAGVGG